MLRELAAINRNDSVGRLKTAVDRGCVVKSKFLEEALVEVLRENFAVRCDKVETDMLDNAPRRGLQQLDAREEGHSRGEAAPARVPLRRRKNHLHNTAIGVRPHHIQNRSNEEKPNEPQRGKAFLCRPPRKGNGSHVAEVPRKR